MVVLDPSRWPKFVAVIGQGLRLRRRVQLAGIAFILLALLNLGATMWTTARRDQASSVVDNKLAPARGQVATLVNHLTLRSDLKSTYLITGDRSALEQLENVEQATDHTISSLSNLLVGYPALQDRLLQVEASIRAWNDGAVYPEVKAIQARRQQDAFVLVASESRTGLFRRASDDVDTLRNDVNQALLNAEHNLERERQQLNYILYSTAVLTLLGMMLLLLGLNRWLSRPIDRLNRAVRAVAGGSLHLPITPEGPPELYELGSDTEAMRRRIVAELEGGDRARDALAKRGLVVVTLRDELAASKTRLPSDYRLGTRFSPAEGILAGDWWDVIRTEDGRLLMALVDVSGHGPATGVFALRTKSLVLAALGSGWNPGEAFGWVHRQLGTEGEHFLTGVIIEIDEVTGRLRYASAGHPDMILTNQDGTTTLLEATGPLLGPWESEWETRTATLSRGCVVVAYSDGLVEARNEQAEEFGIDRLRDLVADETKGASDIDPEELVQEAVDASAAFAAVRHDDDTTIIALSRRG